MATRPDERTEEDFASRLIELDEALAGETPLPADDTTAEEPMAERLRSAKACLERIERFRAAEQDSRIGRGASADLVEDTFDPDAIPQRIGRFQILRELGRGGYGVVFLAHDPNLQRDVALKVPRPEVMLTAELRRRFLREAKAAAALNHAHVVPVFEVGSAGPIAFIATAYCDGLSLAGWLSERREGISPRTAAQLVVTLAEAVQHAHSRGVVHRDLKPGNILLETRSAVGDDAPDESDVARPLEKLSPLVSDFGLAKVLDVASEETRTTAILGTPAYMAPEQAAGRAKQVGTAADIYALGAILYELLTRQPPLKKVTDLATLQAVQTEEPVAPRRRRADVPRDLDAVCLKCLEKEPARRYASATALAEDLSRFLDGKPVLAQPISRAARLARWCRRNPMVAGLTTTAALLLVAVAVISSVSAWRLAREQTATQKNLDRALSAEDEASRTADVAKRRLFDALRAQSQAARRSGRAGQRFDSLAAIDEAMSLELDINQQEHLTLRNEAIASLSLVDVQMDRTWPLNPRTTRHGIAFDPGLQRFAYGMDMVVYDVEDRHPMQDLAGARRSTFAPQYRFGPFGRFLAAKSASRSSAWVQVWDLDNSETVLNVPAGGRWYFSDFDFSPDGRAVVVAQPNNEIAGYDLRSAGEVFRHTMSATPQAVRFHPREPLLAIGFLNHAEVFDIASGRIVARSENVPPIGAIDFHPDGNRIAVGGEDGVVRVFDVTDGKRLHELTGHRSAVVHVDFNQDGTLLATTGWDTTTRIWDPDSGEQLLVAEMACHSFSRDDTWLGIGSVGPVTGRWKLAPRREYQRFSTLDDAANVYSVDVGPSGRMIAAGCDTQIVIWAASPGAARVVIPTFGLWTSVVFEDSGRGLLSSDSTGTYRWPINWDEDSNDATAHEQLIQIGSPVRLADRVESGMTPLAPELLTRGVSVRCSRSAGLIKITDSANGEEIATLAGHLGVTSIAMSPDRQWAATATSDGRDVLVWNVATGEVSKRISCGYAAVAFAPDGSSLAVETASEYTVYHVPSWDTRYRIERTKKGRISAPMAYSADGSLLAVADELWIVRLIDARRGREVASLFAPVSEIICAISFRSECNVLAAGTETGTVHYWDLGRIRDRLANLRLDWEPGTRSPSRGMLAGSSVRFEIDDVSPMGALRSLASDNQDGYRNACAYLRDQAQSGHLSRGPMTEIVLACTAADGGLKDSDPLLGMLEDQFVEFPFDHDVVVPLMAIRHRRGELDEAVKLSIRERLIYSPAVNQPRVANWVKGLRVVAFAHLAMTYHQLGELDKAKQHLADAEKLLDEIVAIRESGDYLRHDLPPERFLVAELLLEEARATIDITD